MNTGCDALGTRTNTIKKRDLDEIVLAQTLDTYICLLLYFGIIQFYNFFVLQRKDVFFFLAFPTQDGTSLEEAPLKSKKYGIERIFYF